MQIFRDIAALRAGIAALRTRGETVAMVPTMGALHAGHIALVQAAKALADHVVVSIFVNPTQFAANEDLAAYPRRETNDLALLQAAGVAIVWMPMVETMYPEGFATTVHLGGVTEELEGTVRPGHFDGVATVVAKLFGQVRPDIACFGEKDYQQLVVVRRMVADLDLGIEIVGVPTSRDTDGLALSSRNAYLDAKQRSRAAALPEVLVIAGESIGAGEDVAAISAWARQYLIDSGFDSVDYFTLCNAATLAPLSSLTAPARLLVAARIGGTRLIDNIAINP